MLRGTAEEPGRQLTHCGETFRTRTVDKSWCSQYIKIFWNLRHEGRKWQKRRRWHELTSHKKTSTCLSITYKCSNSLMERHRTAVLNAISSTSSWCKLESMNWHLVLVRLCATGTFQHRLVGCMLSSSALCVLSFSLCKRQKTKKTKKNLCVQDTAGPLLVTSSILEGQCNQGAVLWVVKPSFSDLRVLVFSHHKTVAPIGLLHFMIK